MQVSQLTIDNFRGIRKAALQFSGHTLLIGGNTAGRQKRWTSERARWKAPVAGQQRLWVACRRHRGSATMRTISGCSTR